MDLSLHLTTSQIPQLLHCDQLVSDDKHKADILNDYFASCWNTLEKPLDELIFHDTDNLPPFEDTIISAEQVFNLISQLDTNKANGPDGISAFMLKSTASSIASPLAKLFSCSILTGKFPTIWKIASIVPIPKSGHKNDPSNYRPISLLRGRVWNGEGLVSQGDNVGGFQPVAMRGRAGSQNPQKRTPADRVRVQGVRRVWGTMKVTTPTSLKHAISKFCSVADLQVKRKTIGDNAGRVKRWWFVIRPPEDAMIALDNVWEQIKLQTGWKLELCFKPFSSNTTSNESSCSSPKLHVVASVSTEEPNSSTISATLQNFNDSDIQSQPHISLATQSHPDISSATQFPASNAFLGN